MNANDSVRSELNENIKNEDLENGMSSEEKIRPSNVWRLHLRTGSVRNGKVSTKYLTNYCVVNRIMAMGYPVSEDNESKITDDFNSYLQVAKNKNDYNYVNMMVNDVKTNDLVLLSDGTDVYIARKKENSKWHYVVNDEAKKYDISNQIDNIDWYKVDNFDKKFIPKTLSNFSRRIWLVND
ncbi:MAG: hypothetical protein ACI4NE_01050, partial [Succinivibrio sp.]